MSVSTSRPTDSAAKHATKRRDARSSHSWARTTTTAVYHIDGSPAMVQSQTSAQQRLRLRTRLQMAPMVGGGIWVQGHVALPRTAMGLAWLRTILIFLTTCFKLRWFSVRVFRSLLFQFVAVILCRPRSKVSESASSCLWCGPTVPQSHEESDSLVRQKGGSLNC